MAESQQTANIWQRDRCGWSRTGLRNKCLIITLNLVIIVSLSEIQNAHESSRCVVGGGFHSDVYSVLLAPVMWRRRVIDYSDHGTACFTQISLWPYRWEITSTAERMIGGKRDGLNLLSHYHSPVRKGWREWEGGGNEGRGRERQRERAKQRQTERKRGINQQGRRMRERNAAKKKKKKHWEAGAKIAP